MVGTLDKLLKKGKEKLQAQLQGGSHSQQGYPGQQQQSQPQYPAQHPPSPYGAPPNQYGPGAPQHPPSPYGQPSPYGPPPTQYGAPPQNSQLSPHSPYPPQQPHYGPPQQQPLSPPIPFGSKPQTPQPPAIPGRPSSFQPPPGPPPSQPQVYWQPSFSASTPVTANFRHELGAHGWGNNEKQDYTSSPANSFHHNDKLIIRALVQNGTYTSARLTSHQTLSRPRGYLTATILPPVARGIWPAYWMLPQAPFSWPTDGEIDIFESSNGACKTLSCLHWGHFNGPDHDKHRVVETQLPDIRETPHTYGFSWSEEEGIPEWRGRLLWYIDGRPVMKANIPKGTRRMEEFTILLNIAMGGTLCQGVLPEDGYYDMVVGDMRMCEEPPGGWTEFERAWASSPEGKGM